MLRKALLPTLNAVATSSTAVLDMPLGRRIHAINLELGDSVGTTLASGNLIREIRVKLNGKVQRTHTGVELNAINLSMGSVWAARTSGAGATLRTYLPIWFAEPWRNNPKEAADGAWNLDGIDSMQVEVDILAVTAPVVTGTYEWDPLTGKIGAIQKWIRQTFAAVGTVQDFTKISRREFIQAIYLFPTTDATPRFVNKAQLRVDGRDVQELISTLQNQVILLNRELNPDVAAVPRFDMVLDYDDAVNNALDARAVQELLLHVEYNLAAAANMVAIMQTVGAPD